MPPGAKSRGHTVITRQSLRAETWKSKLRWGLPLTGIIIDSVPSAARGRMVVSQSAAQDVVLIGGWVQGSQ